jgi:hypothetical protein
MCHVKKRIAMRFPPTAHQLNGGHNYVVQRTEEGIPAAHSRGAHRSCATFLLQGAAIGNVGRGGQFFPRIVLLLEVHMELAFCADGGAGARGMQEATGNREERIPIAGTSSGASVMSGERNDARKIFHAARHVFALTALMIAGIATAPSALADGFVPLGGLPGGGRYAAASTVMQNGKVLVAGGINGSNLATALVYDPATGFSSTGNNLAAARGFATASLLTSGKVLIAGGGNYDESGAVTTAEIYDPATNLFSVTAGPMKDARNGATATRLPSGKVLITGGVSTDGLTRVGTAELYDPATNNFAYTGSPHVARDIAVAALLPNGKVLLAGGGNGSGESLASSELYDPTSGTWTLSGSMSVGRDDATGTLLPNGKVLVANGINNDITIASAEIYDPATGKFTLSASSLPARHFATATLLPSGKVLIAGGVASATNVNTLTSAYLYDPTTDKFTATGSLNEARYYQTADLLQNGQVLVTGGYNDAGVVSTAELYDPVDLIFENGFEIAGAGPIAGGNPQETIMIEPRLSQSVPARRRPTWELVSR